MINRRRYILEKYKLIHYWDASDGLINNQWVDRIGGLKLDKVGIPVLENNLFKTSRNSGYFQLNMNDTNNGLNLGDSWIVEAEFIISEASTALSSPIDFGSVTAATHSFGFYVDNPSKMFSCNPKFNGASPEQWEVKFPFEQYYNQLVKASIGVERTNVPEVNIPFYTLNGNKQYSPNTISKTYATFNRNFNTNMMYVGRISYSNVSSDTPNSYKYIKSIKIFKQL